MISTAQKLGYRPINPHRPEPLSSRSVPEQPAFEKPGIVGFRPLPAARWPSDPAFTKDEVARIYDPFDDHHTYKYRGNPAVDILLAQLGQVAGQEEHDSATGSIKVPVAQPEQPTPALVEMKLPDVKDDQGKKIT